MRRILILIIFVISVSAEFAYCQNRVIKMPPAQVEQISSERIVIYDDAFVSRVLNNDLKFERIKRLYMPSNIKTVPLVKAPLHGQASTILSFTTGKDSLCFLDNKRVIFPLYINIYTTEVALDKQLKTGASKEYFLKRYKLKTVPDHIRISDIEQGCVFQFYFKNNRLYNIRYTATVD